MSTMPVAVRTETVSLKQIITTAKDSKLSPDGVPYRDLNNNGRLDPYEDPRLPTSIRVEDLVSQMTLEEKAGLMFQAIMEVGPDGEIATEPTPMSAWSHPSLVNDKLMSHFNILSITNVRQAVRWQNSLQELAVGTRLGIPVTLSSDPRHAFTQNVGAAISAGVYSKWCENLGLAAIRSPETVARFAQIAKSEYTALGIRAALHPTIDIATEPRWARQFNTFGQNAELTSSFLAPYLLGFQGDKLGPESVACMAKHFPGGGAQKDGEDPHFPYGREQVYPGNNFEHHLGPFRQAIDLGVQGMMPYYSLPRGLVRNGVPIEEVGFAFNRQIITEVLREELGFDGVVCCDWAIINEQKTKGHQMEARAWGVEQLSPLDRLVKAIEAGVDQFGGEATPELVIEAVRTGRILESRIDASVRRLLKPKFELGLFDNPFVDEEHAARTVGCAEFRAAGFEAQCQSLTLLKNLNVLPANAGVRIFAPDIPSTTLETYGTPVNSPQDADLAILRLAAPWEPRSRYFLEDKYHAGSLAFSEDRITEIVAICQQVPTVVDIYLDRPAVIPEISASAAALIANYGASDEALLEVVFGRVEPLGRLPFEMPSSMEAVRDSPEDVAGTRNPLYPFGHGLTLISEAD